MISSLANFLITILYRGSYPERVSWTLLMYTMGAVGIARVSIEQSRVYSMVYALVLGVAGFIVIGMFIGFPIFTAVLLFVISYLADRIVHDCTLIDESEDASGQGLIAFGRDVWREKKQLIAPDRKSTPVVKNRTAHQPGRTVMWLALAALPLFGLGQFMLRGDEASWSRAKFLLAGYLFSSLALLVTTSFLGLRRYLRQRGAEMPSNVSIAWVAGGLLLVLAILSVAYIAPVPGTWLASIEIGDWLNSRNDQKASRYGWGNEGAESQSDQDPTVSQDQPDAPPSGESKSGAPPGEASHGNAKDAPPGSEKGGNKGNSKSASDSSDQNESQSGSPKNGGESPSKSDSQGKSESQGKSDSHGKSESPSNNKESNSSEDSDRRPATPDNASKSDSKQPSPDGKKESEPNPKEASPTNEPQPKEDPRKPQKSSQQQPPKKESAASPNSTPPQSPPWMPKLPKLSGLFRILMMIGLFAVVAYFLWSNWDAIRQWWESLFVSLPEKQDAVEAERIQREIDKPLRPFSSFANPLNSDLDPQRAIVITFQAFEAWAREQGCRRSKDETPSEFLRRISSLIPNASEPASHVVDAYNRIVFGRGRAGAADLQAAAAVWQVMSSHP